MSFGGQTVDTTTSTYPHIVTADRGPARLLRLPRVRVAQIVMDHLAHGWSVDEMCRQHPHLSPAEVHAAMLYYWDHRKEIDHDIHEDWQSADQGARSSLPPAIALRIRESA